MNLSTLFFITAVSINLVIGDLLVPLLRDRAKLKLKPFPWIGVLIVKQNNAVDAVTGLVLIAKKLAIANAGEVAMIEKETIRNTTIAKFYKNVDTLWSCSVEDYIVHPEYHDEVLNTIALVKLDPGLSSFYWSPITWPTEFYKPQKNVFIVGFTDLGKKLEQVVYRTVPCSKTSCVKFYKEEGLDFKTLWPSHYMCLKAETSESCVFDSGMALAANSSGEWILLGLSTNGPGCKLPSRHIAFFPYIPWIETNADSDDTRKAMGSDPGWFTEPFDDRDTFMLSHLDNKTIVLKPESGNATREIGNCSKIDGQIIYREDGYFNTGERNPATAIFALSLFDLYLNKVTCVLIRVNCTEMSDVQYETVPGFEQDYFEDVIKTIPIPNRMRTVPPKILYVKDNLHKYDNIEVRHMFFKFKFVGVATIDVKFYGKYELSTTTSTTTPPTTNTTTTTLKESTTRTRSRPTRKYSTHLRGQNLRKKARKNTKYW